ncbi:hypothetical protein GOV11_04095 [Candidatus Woesearchaeota archaeon]|nr:hypothetical protein [Candidatus Woesearchaeota archaeon]
MTIIPPLNINEEKKKQILEELLTGKKTEETQTNTGFSIDSLEDEFIIKGLNNTLYGENDYTLHIRKEDLVTWTGNYDLLCAGRWSGKHSIDGRAAPCWRPPSIFDYVSLAKGLSNNKATPHADEVKKMILRNLNETTCMSSTAVSYSKRDYLTHTIECRTYHKLENPHHPRFNQRHWIPTSPHWIFGADDLDTVTIAFAEAFGHTPKYKFLEEEYQGPVTYSLTTTIKDNFFLIKEQKFTESFGTIPTRRTM